MIRYLLDTDTLTLLQMKHPLVVRNVATHPAEELATTVISVEEQISGWYRQLRVAKSAEQLARAYDKLAITVSSLARLAIASFTEPAIHRAEILKKQRLTIGKMDLRISAIALEMNATVVTRNIADFGRVPGLVVEDWAK